MITFAISQIDSKWLVRAYRDGYPLGEVQTFDTWVGVKEAMDVIFNEPTLVVA